jgi:YggT family protein
MTKIGNTINIEGMSLAYLVRLLFSTYTILLFVRIVTSWFPAWQGYHLVRFVAFYTDPYLHFFRRILPPLGGVIDISPILAFFALRIIEMLILGML